MSLKRIGFVGIGYMGEPMARNLLRAGFEVTVWNRTHEKAKGLKGDGATVAQNVAEVAEGADAVVTMVQDGAVVNEILFARGLAEAMAPGTIFVDMSSIAPSEARQHAELLEPRGIPALDAPVSGGTKGAAAASLAIMAGGEPGIFASCRAMFEAMGRPTLVGPAGSGQLAKLCNQVIVAVTIGAVSEAILLAAEGGADPAAVRAALMGGFADSRILTEHGKRILERDFEPGGPVRNHIKDLDNALTAAKECGVDLPVTSLVQELYRALAMREGGGELDHSALFLELEKRSRDVSGGRGTQATAGFRGLGVPQRGMGAGWALEKRRHDGTNELTMGVPDLTRLPAWDPTRLLRYRDGIYAADFLACAVVHLDLFTWLAGHPSSLAEICAHFEIDPRPADVLMTLCLANELVVRKDETYRVTPLAGEHLASGSPWSLAPYYASLRDRPVVKEVLAVLRSGKPANWESEITEADWHNAMGDRDFAEMFTAAMDCRGLYLGQRLAISLDLAGRKRVLDVGGGSGIYSCCLVAANRGLGATVFEKGPVDEIASRRIDERGLGGQVAVVAGDLFVDEYPEGHDVHLLSNVLHDWDLPEVERILQKSFATLPGGGLLVAHEAFLNEEKSGPLPVAEYSTILVTITQGRCYGVGEIREMMERVGFERVQVVETAADRSAILAAKPA